MSEKRESDEFEDEDADEVAEGDDPDLDHLFKDLETQKRRGGPKPGEPAWRRLEKLMEQKRTAELLSDFEDYDIGDGDEATAGDAVGDTGDGGQERAAQADPSAGRRKVAAGARKKARR